MNSAVQAFDAVLPVRIDRAEVDDPTLLLGGESWSMSATCHWRWRDAHHSLVTHATRDADDLVWDLIGDEILRATWIDRGYGADPVLTLRSGGELELISDVTFDTWVIHIPELVLVGPLLAAP